MRYVALIFQNDAEHAQWSQEQLAAEQRGYMDFGAEAGKFIVGSQGVALRDSTTATTVRVRDGKTVTEPGPVVQAQEQCCGYYLLNCRDLDEAIEVAAKIPSAKNGAIELRPIVEFS